MQEVNLGGLKPKYTIQVSCSILYEIALDIASFTWDQVHDKLDKGMAAIIDMETSMSAVLKREVDYSASTHSWRCILNLAHSCDELRNAPLDSHMDVFLSYIHSLRDDVVIHAAPYLGESAATQLQAALMGDLLLQEKLLTQVETNSLIHDNLRYLFNVRPEDLVSHLERLLAGWHRELVRDASTRLHVLEASRNMTLTQSSDITDAELIKNITMGGEITAEPGVTTLWLIPQISYRPFTIRNHRANTSVFYYPVSDKQLSRVAEREELMKVAALHKAVGDAHRLRLLRSLTKASKSLAELSNTINASKSATHHHLLLLRSAGLICAENGVYTMNRDEVSKLGPALCSYVQIHHSEVDHA